MNDIGNWEEVQHQQRQTVGAGGVLGLSTYEDNSYYSEDEERDILFSGVFSFLHGLPRLHNGDLLLLQGDEIIQLLCC